jgi:2-hydroxychromene-2-carboxylate isomerase
MKTAGNAPPMLQPNAAARAKFMRQDIARAPLFFGCPEMKPVPENFFGPAGPADRSGLAADLRYMRLLVAVEKKRPECLDAATAGVFDMIWTDDREPGSDAGAGRVIVDDTRLVSICERAGVEREEAEALVASVGETEVKQWMVDRVEECVGLGGFGFPLMRLDPESVVPDASMGRPFPAAAADRDGSMLFFGSDRLEQLAHAAGREWRGPDPEGRTGGASRL